MFVALIKAQLIHFGRNSLQRYSQHLACSMSLKIFNCFANFFLEDMICQDKCLVCYNAYSFFDVYMKNVISSRGIS